MSGQRLVKGPLSPGALAAVTRGKMLPPTSAIDLYSRALDAHLTPAQIATCAACAPIKQLPVWEPLPLLRASGTSGHDAVDAVSRALIRAVKPRGAVPTGTHSRGVIDHALCYRRISNTLFAPRAAREGLSLCRLSVVSPHVNAKTSATAEGCFPPSRARAPRD